MKHMKQEFTQQVEQEFENLDKDGLDTLLLEVYHTWKRVPDDTDYKTLAIQVAATCKQTNSITLKQYKTMKAFINRNKIKPHKKYFLQN